VSLKNISARSGTIDSWLDCLNAPREREGFFEAISEPPNCLRPAGRDRVSYKVILNQQRTGGNMNTQRGIDWYVMFLILLLMLWSIVPVYVSYLLHHG
jgi:hypothetical protein